MENYFEVNREPVCNVSKQVLNHRAFGILLAFSESFPMQQLREQPPELPGDFKLNATIEALEHKLGTTATSDDDLAALFELCKFATRNIVNGTFTPEDVLNEFQFKSEDACLTSRVHKFLQVHI